jgi:hypothetical protein
VGAEPSYVLDVLPATLLFGLGLAMTVAPLTATVLAAVPEALAGTASGVNNAVARVAGLLAIAAVGAVVAAAFSGTLDRELRGAALDARASAAVERAREQPLGPPRAPRDAQGAARVDAAAREAAVGGFHAGMIVSAALVALGGAISLALLPPARPRAR